MSSNGDPVDDGMSHVTKQRGWSDRVCPDTATIFAVVDGAANESVRRAYAQHLAQCSACLDLDSRLRNFDRPWLPDEAEWTQAEKRLDNWMTAYLDSKALSPQRLDLRAASAGVWPSIWRPGFLWKTSLAVGIVALVAVGLDLHLRLRTGAQENHSNVATGTIPNAEQLPLPTGGARPRNEPPEPRATTTGHGNVSRTKVPNNNAVNVEPDRNATTTVPTSGSASVPKDRATLGALASSGSETIRANSDEMSSVGRRPAITAYKSTHPTVRSARAPTAVEGYAPGAGDVPQTTASSPAPHEDSRGDTGGLPASLSLGAGARLWIVLNSVSYQTPGSFSFHGSLLLPFNASASLTLDRGTQVFGSGTDADGHTSLLVSEIVLRGAYYKLKTTAGAGTARPAGKGGVVPFDSGHVLEMWLSSNSVYERSVTEPPR